MLSAEYDLIYVQQAEELTEHEWETLTTRLRNGVMPYQQLIGDANPGPPHHWLKRRADHGQLVMIESRHEDNLRLFDRGGWTAEGATYIARLDTLTGVRYQRLRLGKWVAGEGIVYEDFDRAVHLIDRADLPPLRRYLVSCDFGFSNPGVFQVWGLDSDNRLYLVHEVYQSQRTIDWWIDQGKRMKAEYKPVAWVCDPSEPGFIRQFVQAGLPAKGAKNDVVVGIQEMQQRLRIAGDGKPRLYVVRDSLADRDKHVAEPGKPLGFVEEIEGYVWPQGVVGKPLKETPVGVDDHALDTARYACMWAAKPPVTGTIRSVGRSPNPAFSGAGDLSSYRPLR